MGILTTYVQEGACNGTYDLVNDVVVSSIGSTDVAFILMYFLFIFFLVLLFGVSRSVIVGALAGIFGFTFIVLLGSINCLPMPANIITIGAIIAFIFSIIGAVMLLKNQGG